MNSKGMAGTSLFLYGEDTYRSSEKLRSLEARYIDAALGDTNLVILDGARVSYEDWYRQVQALPFLARTRLVICKNLLLAGTKEAAGRIIEALPRVPATTVTLFYEAGLPDQRTEGFRRLSAVAKKERFDLLTGQLLLEWIQRESAQLGGGLSEEGIVWLAERFGGNLWQLRHELEKLAAFRIATGVQLEMDDIKQLVLPPIAGDRFRLLEVVLAGRGKDALAELAHLKIQGEADLAIFGLIVYQFRTALLMAEALAEGVRQPGVLAKILGMPPFAARKLMPLVSDRPLSVWLEWYHELLGYDARMKIGELDPDLALELLISRQSFASGRGAAHSVS